MPWYRYESLDASRGRRGPFIAASVLALVPVFAVSLFGTALTTLTCISDSPSVLQHEYCSGAGTPGAARYIAFLGPTAVAAIVAIPSVKRRKYKPLIIATIALSLAGLLLPIFVVMVLAS